MISFDGLQHHLNLERSNAEPVSSRCPVQESFRALTNCLDRNSTDPNSTDPNSDDLNFDVRNAATRFTDVAVSAVERDNASPELILHCMKLRNPRSGENLFVELDLFPGLVAAVCYSISRELQKGKPVSSEALQGLCDLASHPHMSGITGSILAYQILVRGLTNFYQQFSGYESEEPIMTPENIVSELGTNLHRTALCHPLLVAKVVEGLGTIPLSPTLIGHLDLLLWNTAHPSNTGVPSEVRIAAVHAIADVILRPLLLFSCDENVGALHTRRAVELFILLAKECPHADVVTAVLDRLPDILRRAANDMMSSWTGLTRSTFLDGEYPVAFRSQIRALLPIVESLVQIGACGPWRVVELSKMAKQASRIDWGVRTVGLVKGISSCIPFVPETWIKTAMYSGLRVLDRLFDGSAERTLPPR